jgi:hypothetical protein
MFHSIFDRHLGPDLVRDNWRRPYEKLTDDVAVLAVNPLDNHYHLVILQKRPGGLLRFMRALLTAYGHHFNTSHGRRAQIFESPHSVRIAGNHDDVRYLIGYVHANHEILGLQYEFSSHLEYIGARGPRFIACGIGLRLFGDLPTYLAEMEWHVDQTRKRKAERRKLWTPPASRSLRRGPGSHIPIPE